MRDNIWPAHTMMKNSSGAKIIGIAILCLNQTFRFHSKNIGQSNSKEIKRSTLLDNEIMNCQTACCSNSLNLLPLWKLVMITKCEPKQNVS